MTASEWSQNTSPMSRPQTPSAGAVWRRVDLHLHSPGVKGFVCPDGSDLASLAGRKAVVESYVNQLANQGISVAAITDYNGMRIDWFEAIAAEATSRRITLLPGAEVSFMMQGKHGLHVLIVFSSDTDLAGINVFLQSLHKDPATPLLLPDGSHRDIDPKVRLAEVLKSLKDRFNCLILFPHPDQTNGLFKSFGVRDAAELLKEVRPDAIEHCPGDWKGRLASAGVLPEDYWDHLPFVEFSDPRRIEEIGTKRRSDGSLRATYLKLSATDMEALRLAVHDPHTRLAIGSIPEPVHARVRAMVVSGSGFLGDQSIAWNDDLNVIIGGRGAGKSAILETLRYALNLPMFSDQPYREDLVRHALGSGGQVELLLERPLGNGRSRQYRVTRVWGEEPRVVEADTGQPVAVPTNELLGPSGGPTLFGQREIYAVSGSEEYRLRLLDELIGEEARRHSEAVRGAIEELRGNARAILDARERLAKRDEYRQRLKAIEHEIGIYEKHSAAQSLREAAHLEADTQLLRSALEAVDKAHQEWTETKQNLLAPLKTAHRNVSRGQSSQRAVLLEAARTLEGLQVSLGNLLDSGNSAFVQAKQKMDALERSWQAALRPLQEEINRIKQEVQTETLDPDRILKAAGDRAALAPVIEDLDRVEDHLNGLLETRWKLLQTVRERRHLEHQLRRERAQAIADLLGGRLALKVDFKGHKDDYRKRLAAILKGSGLSQTALDQLVAPEATDGIALAEAVRAGVQELQSRFDLTAAMAVNLVKWLTTSETRLFEVETLIPPDSLQVQLKVEDRYLPLERLSVGQRAAAVLLLLFALEGRVLVVDQPEDDLDNQFVYENVVQILRNSGVLVGRDGGERAGMAQ